MSLSFKDVVQFPRANYEVHMPLNQLIKIVGEHMSEYGLDLNPDFQRGHVWTKKQQSSFMEYMLKGGEGGRCLSFNHLHWGSPGNKEGGYQILDGKQRLHTALMFLADRVEVFGGMKFSQFSGRVDHGIGFLWRVFALPTREDVLYYYLSMNAGGTPHSAKEIRRVRDLYAAEVDQRILRETRAVALSSAS